MPQSVKKIYATCQTTHLVYAGDFGGGFISNGLSVTLCCSSTDDPATLLTTDSYWVSQGNV